MKVVTILAMMVGIVLASAFGAFVFENLWNWFMYPVIGKEITFGIAWGLVLMLTFVQQSNAKEKIGDDKFDTIKIIVYSFSISTMTLIIGFFIHKYLM